ncbi:MAG: hypothetical protein GXO80_10955 [Chlorobi bacterium]|nr:hypothetical protein [Chlorobiota bacterium]
MKTLKKTTIIRFFFLFSLIVLFSCNKDKYDDFENTEIIENTYTGTVGDISGDSDPDANYAGTNDSGTYSFAWVNSSSKAKVKFDITSSSAGDVQLILNDAKGKEVLNKTLTGSSDVDFYDGLSEEGDVGTWRVSFIFSNFNGGGSFEIDNN